MSMETLTFKGELRQIVDCHVKLREAASILRNFILSALFLVDFIKFEQLLGDFQDKVITLVEVVQTPIPGLPKTEKEEETEKEEKEEEFSLPKAVVVAVTILACTVALYQNLIPPIAFIGAVSANIGLMFLPQIRSVIASLRPKEEEEETPSMKLEDWINESISKIRALYTSARFLNKVQDQSKETLPYYSELGLDEALYDRRKYFNETLPSEFLSRIGKIMVACDKNVWSRRSLIVSAIVQTRQATAKVS